MLVSRSLANFANGSEALWGWFLILEHRGRKRTEQTLM